MKIEKIIMNNFRRFNGIKEIDFNNSVNILIGDNEAGKSSILMALDIVLSGSLNKVENIGLENLFNVNVIKEYLKGERKFVELPKLEIYVFLSECNKSELEGENYYESNNVSRYGIKFVSEPNEEFSKEIKEILDNEDCAFPFEYYKNYFKTFSNLTYNSYNKPVKHMLLDNSDLNSDYAIKEYSKILYKSNVDQKNINYVKNAYRMKNKEFEKNVLNLDIDDIKFGILDEGKMSIENNLTIYEDDVSIFNKGTGKVRLIKTEYALKKQADNIDILLIEEPENHLSYLNMRKMIDNLSKSLDKQIFLTTHSNMICSRLDLRNIIFMNSTSEKIIKLSNVSEDTAAFFIKAPNNNILNFILAQKVILIEGDAEFILMEHFYKQITGNKPEENDVAIISVNGVSFKRYLEIAKLLNLKVVVITDNDGDYDKNICKKYEEYLNLENIKVCSEEINELKTFEVSLYNNNIKFYKDNIITRSEDIQEFMLNNKSEHAYRLLKVLEVGNDTYTIPEYIKEAIKWIKN